MIRLVPESLQTSRAGVLWSGMRMLDYLFLQALCLHTFLFCYVAGFSISFESALPFKSVTQ